MMKESTKCFNLIYQLTLLHNNVMDKLNIGNAVLVTVFVLSLLGCDDTSEQHAEPLNVTQEFSDYWFQGQAELTSYRLEQVRYGEVHPGHAVLIFVTEDFSRSKQVKLDNPQEAGSDGVKIMKLNATRKFNTGVYPYSMMESVFTPLNYKPASTLKITASSQEWCGHTFAQMNNRNGQFKLSLKSYFESEGDQELSVSTSLLEDELWTTIRLDPEQLPKGNIEMIPSLLYARLSHRPSKSESVIASLSSSDSTTIYQLEYQNFDRTLTIRYNSEFPYEIQSWEESYTSGFGDNAKKLTTRAVLDKRIMLNYWSKHDLVDSVWRQQLNLK